MVTVNHSVAMSNLPAARGVLFALLATLLFGASTPLVQRAGVNVGGWMTAALLYAGAAVAGLLLLAGCKRGVENTEAVRQAIVQYLAGRPNMDVSAMQIDVVSVSFRQNEADATVSIKAKGAQGGQGMTMNYTLEKKGDNWVVKGRKESGSTPHGAAGQMPGAMPGTGMPPDHPSVGGAQPPAETKK